MPPKLPWFPFYPTDWLSDQRVALMEPAEKGIYIDLLAHAWLEGSIPSDPIQLAFLLRLPRRQFNPLWEVVRLHFVPSSSPSRLVNRRMEERREHAQDKSENARKAAEARWRPDADADAPGIDDASPTRSRVRERDRKTLPPAAPQLQLSAPPPAESSAAPPRAGKKAKPKKEPDPIKPLVDSLCDFYSARWVELLRPADGKPPKIDTADFLQARAVVVEHGIDAALGFVRRFLADPDPFLQRSAWALRHLPSRLNAYRVTAAPRAQSKPSPLDRPRVKEFVPLVTPDAVPMPDEVIRAMREKLG